MEPLVSRTRHHRQHQHGAMLLEALIAILIFSIGILGVVGMQAMTVKQSTDARYRVEAALLAQQLVGKMWVANRNSATLKANFSSCTTSTSCPDFTAWYGTVTQKLPGVQLVGPTAPEVAISDVDGTVKITLRWRAPGDDAAAPHSYNMLARIPPP